MKLHYFRSRVLLFLTSVSIASTLQAKDTSSVVLCLDGTARVTRVVPVPTTISPEAQKALAKIKPDSDSPQTLEQHVFEALWHAFWNDPDLPESREAVQLMAAFFDKHLGK